jgi:hypothetical protein
LLLRRELIQNFSNSDAVVSISPPDYFACYDGKPMQGITIRSMITRWLYRPVHCVIQLSKRQPQLRRPLSSATALDEPPAEVSTPSVSHRWLSDVKQRIGKCIMFGMKPDQVDEACRILRDLARDWRNLIAGSEGFLTGKGRVGLQSQAVVWGEQDKMVG